MAKRYNASPMKKKILLLVPLLLLSSCTFKLPDPTSSQGGEGTSQTSDTASAISLSVPNGLQVDSYVTATVEGASGTYTIEPTDEESAAIVSVEGNKITGLTEGTAFVVAVSGNERSDAVRVTVSAKSNAPASIEVMADSSTLIVGETLELSCAFTPVADRFVPVYEIARGPSYIGISGNVVTGKAEGSAAVAVTCEGVVSNLFSIDVVTMSDPYENMSRGQFYANYEPATSPTDAKYRSEHGFLSGEITDTPNYLPVYSSTRPTENGSYVRNSGTGYNGDRSAYTVVDSNGNEAFTVYEGGGYIGLDEVCAYVYAFGDVPANYLESKTATSEALALWSSDLRLNHSFFSDDVEQYPYEPVLPGAVNVDEGGNLYYYEIDFGTGSYNNGSRINRGTSRIVYSRYKNGWDEITDPNERHVFYTYNHYNDFEEFLNYEGGYGARFGNETGGGTERNPNPTSYPETVNREF